MNRLIRTELRKVCVTRTPLGCVAAGPVMGGLVAVAILTASGHQGNDPLGPESLTHILGGPAGGLTLVALLTGVLATAGEYRHGTITTTFLAVPRRRSVVVAKLTAGGMAGATMAALSLLVGGAIAVPWLATAGVSSYVDGETVRVAAALVASTALYGALGVGVGALLRNQTAAATAVLVWLLTGERLVSLLFSGADVGRWLPAAAGRTLVHVGPGADLPLATAAVVLAAYVALFGLAGACLTDRRDIS